MSSMSNTRTLAAYLVLTFLTSFAFSLPAVLLNSPSLSLVQDSPALELSQATNLSVVNASTLSLPTADDFPIPHSDYTLRLGNLGPHLHPWDLETLLIAVSAAIEEEIAAYGRNARLPSTQYSKDLAGLHLWMQRMPWDTVNLAWAQLAIILDGLWLYIVDGGHDREAFIDVINHVTGRQIALGWIGKPHRPLEPTPSTGAVRKGLEALASRQVL